MDVTSMLNALSECKEELKQVLTDDPPPNRNRTPWDAGGYSLPIIQQRKLITVDSSIHHYESPRDSPVEPLSRHSSSDSRTSLSSFASATTSGTHSRFSSASTLSGFHTFPSIKAEPFTEQDDGPHREKLHLRSPSPTLPLAPTAQAIDESPQTCFFSSLTTIANGKLQEYQGEKLQQESQGQMVKTRPIPMEFAGEKGSSPAFLRRPASPSDAILIRRSGPAITRSQSDFYELTIRTSLRGDRSDEPQTQENSSFEFLPSRLSHSPKSHKRAISAPAFQALPNPLLLHDAQDASYLSPKAEPTPSLSPDLKQEFPSLIIQPTRPVTPTQTGQSLQDQQPKCMFSQDCDTGSPPRKAISHIFGRNKMCTRLIPQQVWVHLCRKHYQRSRYRNLTLFAHNTQCELVQQQVQNLEEWSEANKLSGEGGVVKDWELAVRKREQKRLDELGSAKNSGSVTKKSPTESRAMNLCSSTPSTAPPDWLRNLCGTGYQTSEIRNILSRLQQDMIAGVVSVFPDIEILPNIVIDKEDPKSPKGYAKRKAVHGSHQRSKSLGNALRSDHIRPERRMSQLWLPSSLHNESLHYDDRQSRKRKTYEERDGDDCSRSPPLSQNVSRIVPVHRAVGPMHQPLCTALPDAEYYIREEEFGTHTSIKNYHYQPLRSSHGPPLPAPTPRRHKMEMATRLEEHPYLGPRSLHRRSQSDIGAFRLTPPAEHYLEQSRYLSAPISYASLRDMPSGHARRQSSPLVDVQRYTHNFAEVARRSKDSATKQNTLPPQRAEHPREAGGEASS